jgi:hypothetical protein
MCHSQLLRRESHTPPNTAGHHGSKPAVKPTIVREQMPICQAIDRPKIHLDFWDLLGHETYCRLLAMRIRKHNWSHWEDFDHMTTSSFESIKTGSRA